MLSVMFLFINHQHDYSKQKHGHQHSDNGYIVTLVFGRQDVHIVIMQNQWNFMTRNIPVRK